MTEPEYMNETPGADWVYVEEGEELTTEQATRQFLDQPWEEQLRLMERMREDVGAASVCRMLNHEGAMIFATRHSCHAPEPEIVQGDVVPMDAVEPPKPAGHQCEPWQIVVDHAGRRSYCAACGRDHTEPEPDGPLPPPCPHPFAGQHWNFEGELMCGRCGAVTGRDEQMRIRASRLGSYE